MSEEVKQKRAAKKARGYAIWMSMEIRKVLDVTLLRLGRVPTDDCQQTEIIQSAMDRFSAFLKYQEHKINARNAIGMLHAIAKLTTKSCQPQRLLQLYGSLVVSLFAIVEDHIEVFNGRAVCELIWTFQTLGPDLMHLTAPMLPISLTNQREVDLRSILHSILERASQERVTFKPVDSVIMLRSLLYMDWIEIQPS